MRRTQSEHDTEVNEFGTWPTAWATRRRPAGAGLVPESHAARADVNAQTIWRLITSYIAPELMDGLVQCYLSTSYYILPFLRVPTFLAGGLRRPAEMGQAPARTIGPSTPSRKTASPPAHNGSSSSGASAPSSSPTAPPSPAAVYAIGLGKLSKANALLSEAITISIDNGLHRTYDLFDPVEDEVRKRTFWCLYIWCLYIWDKQLSVHFRCPPMLNLP
ncbi:hypothetical protein B0H11DRAFT_2313763 [Mycena galericulata]|nr:hypothetical protein B0H11DRAFT_2313763 [Mycena galericulata]